MTNLKTGFHLSIDIENLSRSTETLDFERALDPLLARLNAIKVKASFFVLGQLVNRWSTRIIELQSQGHEVGLHGYSHTPLDVIGRQKFQEETLRGSKILSEVLGHQVRGYRAPYFSLTRKSPWAPEIIKENGFIYSSSVLPAWNPQSSFPGAPKNPFKWSCDLVEFPVQSYGIGKLRIPLLGGAYVRLAPEFIFRSVKNLTNTSKFVYTYCHPYDFDTKEDFYRVEDSSWIFSKLLFMRRDLMLNRVTAMLHPDQKTFVALSSDANYVKQLKIVNPIS